MKKVLSILMSAVMLFSMTAGLSITTTASDTAGNFATDSQISSISYERAIPLELIEYDDGYWETDDNGNEYFYYHWYFVCNGDVFNVEYSDGTVVSYVYDVAGDKYISADGKTICGEELEISSNQSEQPWTLGNNNYITVKYMGFETGVAVSIVESPLTSISFNSTKGLKCTEGITYRVDTDNGGYVVSPYAYFGHGDTLTLNYKDGTSETYVAELDDLGYPRFVANDGKLLEYQIRIDEKDYAGGDSLTPTSVTISCAGKSTDVAISSHLTVQSAEFVPLNPVTIIESDGSEEDRYVQLDENGNVIYYLRAIYNGLDANGNIVIKSEIFNYGDLLNVTFSDGTTATYTYKENKSEEFGGYGFFGEDNSVFYVTDISSNQSEQPWVVGQCH